MIHVHAVRASDPDLLRRYDAPTLCNVVELFDPRPRTAGDILHADRNGVTTIPSAVASAAAHDCTEYVAAETVTVEYLRAGKIDHKEYAAVRNDCRDRVEALGRRLHSR